MKTLLKLFALTLSVLLLMSCIVFAEEDNSL